MFACWAARAAACAAAWAALSVRRSAVLNV
jgi:hypothetical protein